MKILYMKARAAHECSHEQWLWLPYCPQFCNLLLSSEPHQCLSHPNNIMVPGALCVPQCGCDVLKLQDAGWLPAVPSRPC